MTKSRNTDLIVRFPMRGHHPYNTTLVVPTVARQRFFDEFLTRWGIDSGCGAWSNVIVVEDRPKKELKLPPHIVHVCWDDIENYPNHRVIFSRKDSAVRIFGFLLAALAGSSIIFTLDDDCYPQVENEASLTLTPHQFVDKHIANLINSKRWCSTIPGVRVRGLPYSNLGYGNDVRVSMGLWQNIPDFDAITHLARLSEIKASNYFFQPPLGNQLVPRNQFFPFCGMNFAFFANLLPIMYFPPMGQLSPYKRFDDIWAGLVLKKCCDHLNYHISIGEPFVEHVKQSCPYKNLRKEAPGIGANEYMWEVVDRVRFPDPSEMLIDTPYLAAKYMASQMHNYAYYNDDEAYVKRWANGLNAWADITKPHFEDEWKDTIKEEEMAETTNAVIEPIGTTEQ